MVSNGGSTGIRHKFDLEKSPKDSKSELDFRKASANFRGKTFSMNVDAFHFEKLFTMLAATCPASPFCKCKKISITNVIVQSSSRPTQFINRWWPPKEFLVVKKHFSFQIWQMQNMVNAFAFIIMLLRMYFQISKLAYRGYMITKAADKRRDFNAAS